MHHIEQVLPSAAEGAGTAIFLEAAPGVERSALLDAWLEHARDADRIPLRLDGDVDEHGVWSALDQLLWSVLPAIRAHAPDLIDRHAYELCLVLPPLRREIQPRNPCLTDVASDEEKVRNYPNDRAYRSLHGLIDLLDECHTREPRAALAIAIDRFDRCTPLVWRFFAELLRRRGAHLGLTLLLAVDPGQRSAAAALFEPSLVQAPEGTWRIPGVAPRAHSFDAQTASRLAAALEERIGDDRIEWSLHMPRLISLWQRSETPARAWPWLMRAVNEYDHAGLYEVAVRFAPALEADLESIRASDPDLHALAVLNLFFCYAALGQPKRGLDLLVTHGLPRVTDPQVLVDIHYFMAMLFARFLPRRDLDRATEHLDRALAMLPDLDVSDARRHFLSVFMRNGLAYVRFRQGRADEALALCDGGLRELDTALRPGKHHLHRSVLLYNAAQVLGALGRTDEAVTQLSRAMQLDPNYSEYYLERGGLLLKQQRFDEAERDLLRAIELSPPYAEAWTDLGQCYRAAGRLLEAERAYNRALDLDPRVVLALIGRGEIRAEVGDLSAAISDYSAALALDATQPLVLAARAVAHFESDQPAAALADLDAAIALDPAMPEFHQNRAVALLALGRGIEAHHELRMYLDLQPDASDRADVERQMVDLAA